MFWVSFHKLLTVVCWNSGPFLLTDLEELSQVCRPPCSDTPFQLCPQIFYRTEIRGLWWPLKNIYFVVLKLLCNWFGGMLRVIVHWTMALTSWLMSWNVPSRFQHNVLSSSCHLLFSGPVPSAGKHPPNMMLPPLYFTVRVMFSGLQASLFCL